MEDFNVYDNREEEEKNTFSKPNEQDMDGDVQEAEFEEVLAAAKKAQINDEASDNNTQVDMKQDDATPQENIEEQSNGDNFTSAQVTMKQDDVTPQENIEGQSNGDNFTSAQVTVKQDDVTPQENIKEQSNGDNFTSAQVTMKQDDATPQENIEEQSDGNNFTNAQVTMKQDDVTPQENIEEQSDGNNFTNAQVNMKQDDVTPQENMEEQSDGDGNDKKTKKPSFAKRHHSACLVIGCVALSTVGAFGGTYLATNLTKANKTVLYQSVKSNASGSSSNNATNMSVKDIANATMNSVVEIKTESVATGEIFQQYVSSGAGSGVILSSDGYIVTNNHVIEGANKISVNTKDGKTYTAKLIGTDATTDLAVIKIEATNLTPAVLGSSGSLAVGDTAIAIGNPLGELGGTVTTGIISALDREITIDNEKMHLLQTSAAINPGNSGGGLFNSAGELIGVVNAKSSGDDVEGLGFAIPIDIAKPIITNLMENGYVKNRGELGVTLSMGKPNNTNPFQNGESASSENIYIVNVTKGKAADLAGLEAGDQITKVDNKVVEDISDVKSAVSSRIAGDKLSITILRDGETKTIQVTLKEAVPESVSNDKQGSY